MADRPTPQEILTTPLECNNAELNTIGKFLFSQLDAIWGKLRYNSQLPPGNANWESWVIIALIRADHLSGTLNEQGFIKEYNEKAYKELMDSVWDFLQSADYATLALPPVPKDHYVVQLSSDESNERRMVDYLNDAYTEEDAQRRADALNVDSKYTHWTIIHIPL